jgi:cyclophilin family peptidyl-prolyl cis-trans isomerase
MMTGSQSERQRLLLGLILLNAASLCAQTHPAPHHVAGAAAAKALEPTGPVVLFDTSAGRATCRLYDKQAPETTARFVALAEGTKDWTDGSGAVQTGKPYYDGLQVFARGDSITAGDRTAVGLGSAGEPVAPEKSGLDFDRGGRLAATITNGKQDAATFMITVDPDLEYSKRAIVFGQCDSAGIALARSVSHTLLSTDNRPEHPVVLRKVIVVAQGQPLPPLTPAAEGESLLTIAPFPPPAVPAPEPTGPTATIETTMGTLTCRLFDKEAPIAVANFIGLANGTKPFRNPATQAEVRGKHFYDGLSFGRVLPDFMVQNADSPGDPHGGGAGYKFGNEIVPGLSFDRPGRMAYANSGPGTNSSEFFVTEHAVRRLDGSYTIFGQCDDASVKVVEAIARVPRDAKNKPLTPVTIKRVTITTPAPMKP